jgi:hypothetical protein
MWFSVDSSIVEIIQQQEWMNFTDVITRTLDDVGGLKLVNDDGIYAA